MSALARRSSSLLRILFPLIWRWSKHETNYTPQPSTETENVWSLTPSIHSFTVWHLHISTFPSCKHCTVSKSLQTNLNAIASCVPIFKFLHLDNMAYYGDGLIWLRIGTSGGFLWTRYWTFEFHEMLGGSWGAAQLTAPQEGLSSVSK
jgi:hypothetical protein